MIMADLKFEDNRLQIKKLMQNIGDSWLEEASGEMEAQTKRNTKVGKVAGGQTKNAWTHEVDLSTQTATIGNPLENALWEEFGTGEYALNGDGRKGSWFIHVGEGAGDISPQVVKAYGMYVHTGKDGEQFVKTKGKKPKRPLFKAYEKLKPKLEKALANKLKELIK